MLGPVAQALHLDHFSQDGFLRLLDYVLEEAAPRRVYSGRNNNPPDMGTIELYPHHVFDVPLAGKKHLIIGGAQRNEAHVLWPGDVLYCPPLAWKLPIWDEPHELCCFVFTEQLIRLTYVNVPVPLPAENRPICACFYHTQLPPSEGIRHMLHTLKWLATEGDAGHAAVDATRALFRMTRAQLAADHAPLLTKAQVTFQRVQQFVRENFGLPINRKQVAGQFDLHPGYLSRLYHEHGDTTFSHALQTMRMEHAALLLCETDLQIDEITRRCGYRSTTFFITAFRQYYGLSPGRFRCRGI